MTCERRCWVEVDLDALRNNLSWIRHRVGKETKVMTVVKADAYGHGLKQIAGHLMQNGTDFFGVANLEEAHAIRLTGKDWPILMLGSCLDTEWAQAVEWGVSVTISSLEEVVRLHRIAEHQKKTAKVHLKVDTGMGRLGCQPGSVLELAGFIHSTNRLHFEGIYTHFADVETDVAFTRSQKLLFRSVLRRFGSRLLLPSFVHSSNSGALIYDRTLVGNMVRPGLLVYGIIPPGHRKPVGAMHRRLKPSLAFYSRVTHIKWIGRGDSLSYGRTYKARRRAKVATVSSGYGDGYPLAASNKAEVLIRGVRCPVLGRVTMDQTLVDVTAISEVTAGDLVTLIGTHGNEAVSATELASRTGSIAWQVLTNITYRVPRIYRGTRAS